MDKVKLVERLCQVLMEDLKAAQSAAATTREAATNEESKPENEYDTRALEASYLAGAQAHRVREIEVQIHIVRQVQVRKYDSTTPIGPTALIELEHDGASSTVFLMPQVGGVTLDFEGQRISVVTPNSALGEALVGLKTGDIATVERRQQTKEYEILSVQ